MSVEDLAQMTAAGFEAVTDDLADVKSVMLTKDDLAALATKAEMHDLRDELRGHFTELKTLAKQTIADEAANTVAIAELRRELTRVKRHVGLER
jgi:hypothetical protein